MGGVKKRSQVSREWQVVSNCVEVSLCHLEARIALAPVARLTGPSGRPDVRFSQMAENRIDAVSTRQSFRLGPSRRGTALRHANAGFVKVSAINTTCGGRLGHDRLLCNAILVTDEATMSPVGTRITIEPGKRGGKPCVRGLRITVWDVLGWLGAGMTEEEILDEHPDLEKADFPAVYHYAAEVGRQANLG